MTYTRSQISGAAIFALITFATLTGLTVSAQAGNYSGYKHHYHAGHQYKRVNQRHYGKRHRHYRTRNRTRIHRKHYHNSQRVRNQRRAQRRYYRSNNVYRRSNNSYRRTGNRNYRNSYRRSQKPYYYKRNVYRYNNNRYQQRGRRQTNRSGRTMQNAREAYRWGKRSNRAYRDARYLQKQKRYFARHGLKRNRKSLRKIYKSGKKARRLSRFGVDAVGKITGAGHIPDGLDAAEWTVNSLKDPSKMPERTRNLVRGAANKAVNAVNTISNPNRMIKNTGNLLNSTGKAINGLFYKPKRIRRVRHY